MICRTARGLEVGEVLSSGGGEAAGDGVLLRKMTVEDELLLARLERRREEAFQACSALLVERGIQAVLVDVEQLFDGSSLFFYFLGETDAEVESLTEELAAAYESRAQLAQFAELLTSGCGPGCGTDEAAGNGCSSGACASCSVVKACGSAGSS